MNFVGPHSTYLNRQNDIQINIYQFMCACLHYDSVPLSPWNPIDSVSDPIITPKLNIIGEPG
jgi:hypothetical protein